MAEDYENYKDGRDAKLLMDLDQWMGYTTA